MRTAISLVPSATEIVVALGAGDRLLAVSDDCRFVEGAPHVPVISRGIVEGDSPESLDAVVRGSSGPLYAFDHDLASRLRPDVVFTQDSCRVCAVPSLSVLRSFERAQLPMPEVVSLDPTDLADVLGTFETVAEALGMAGAGERLASTCRSVLDSLSRPASLPAVLVLDWPSPPFAAGNWVAELVSAAGGVAVGSHSGEPSHEIDLHEMAQQADAVVVAPCGLSTADAARAASELRQQLGRPKRWCALDGRRFFSRPGPGLVAGAAALSSWFAGGPLPATIGLDLT